VGEVKVSNRPPRAAVAPKGGIDPDPEEGELVAEAQPVFSFEMTRIADTPIFTR